MARRNAAIFAKVGRSAFPLREGAARRPLLSRRAAMRDVLVPTPTHAIERRLVGAQVGANHNDGGRACGEMYSSSAANAPHQCATRPAITLTPINSRDVMRRCDGRGIPTPLLCNRSTSDYPACARARRAQVAAATRKLKWMNWWLGLLDVGHVDGLALLVVFATSTHARNKSQSTPADQG